MTKKFQPINTEQLIQTDEPFVSNRPLMSSKYDVFFSSIQQNKRIKVSPEQAQPVANALRSWLKRHKRAGVVRSITKGDDGMGGVWWIVEQKAPKTVWAPLSKKAA